MLEALIAGGQTFLVMHGAKLQWALQALLHAEPGLCTLGKAMRFAHDYTDHIMCMCRVLRTLKKEYTSPTCSASNRRNTSSIRKEN